MKAKARPTTGAVICAAGSASRMGFNKQLELLGQVPVLVHSVMAFEDAPSVAETVLVAREEDIPALWNLVREYELRKVSRIVRGGATRQQSVGFGARSLSPGHALVAVHDGARPLVTAELIERVVADALRFGAAAAAIPSSDTVKLATADGTVERTLARSSVFMMQTPQVFDLGRYLAALGDAAAAMADCTDDCQLFERLGFPVKLTPGSPDNIKLTVPEDFAVAQALLEQRFESLLR